MTSQDRTDMLADQIVAALAGKYHDGRPNTGLIGAMSQGMARGRILDALRLAATPAPAVAVTTNWAIEFLYEAARYFEKRPTNGEDSAFWSNCANAENCRKIARAMETDAALLDAPPSKDGETKSDGRLCPVPPGIDAPVSTETASEFEGESNDCGVARRMSDSESIGSLATDRPTSQCGNRVPPGSPSDPPAQDDVRDVAARIIDPEYLSKYDRELASGRRAENGQLWADVAYGKEREAALAKADAVLALRSQEPRPVVGWRTDMENAPKDRKIALYAKGCVDGGGSVVEGYWYTHPQVSGWITDYFDCSDYDFDPTHWQPLPASPSEGR